MRKKWHPVDGPLQPNGFDDTWVCWQSLRTGKREVHDGYRNEGEWRVRNETIIGNEWFPIAWMYAELPPEPPRESLQSLAMGALLVSAALGVIVGFLVGAAITF